jgi:hypothetical protein
MWIDSASNTMNLYFDVITFTEGNTKVVNATLKLRVKPNTGELTLYWWLMQQFCYKVKLIAWLCRCHTRFEYPPLLELVQIS